MSSHYFNLQSVGNHSIPQSCTNSSEKLLLGLSISPMLPQLMNSASRDLPCYSQVPHSFSCSSYSSFQTQASTELLFFRTTGISNFEDKGFNLLGHQIKYYRWSYKFIINKRCQLFRML